MAPTIPDVVITRAPSTDDGTFGTLHTTDGAFTCYTLELPDRDNARGISCIPRGRYGAIWVADQRPAHIGTSVYCLTGVPGRSGILIHSANLAGDITRGRIAQLQGCIALGQRLGVLGNQRAVLLSRPAVDAFNAHMAGRPFTLEIV